MIIIDNSVPDSEKCELFGPDGKVGDIENIYGFCRVRVEIKSKKLNGYYVVWNGIELPIDVNGKIKDWPKGFGDCIDEYLAKLIIW